MDGITVYQTANAHFRAKRADTLVAALNPVAVGAT
jgi:hypothetical protein